MSSHTPSALANANKSSLQHIKTLHTSSHHSCKDPLFQIESLQVHSGSKRLINIERLNIYKNVLTTFIGPNGAGKSTLLHSLLNQHSGSTLITSGTITNSIGQNSNLVAQGKIAWVGQHERYELPLTALQYALLGVSPQLAWYQAPNQQHSNKANQLLIDFELGELKHNRVQYLSGGEKQRLSIVRALMQDTDILMLDEPTNHLDIRHQRFLLTYLKNLVDQHHKTVIVVLHDLTHAYRYSDDIVLMDAGQIVTHGNPDTVMTQDTLNKVYQVEIEAYDTAGGRVYV